jgi:sugar lactone lactonase YvrE
LDEKEGHISNKREFYRHNEENVRPDGMCTDKNGHLWVALAHGGRLIQIAPDGKVKSEVKVDTSFPTSCAVAQSGCLYVTTSRKATAPGEKLNAWSGSLLQIS